MEISFAINSTAEEICNHYKLEDTPQLKLNFGENIFQGSNNLLPIITSEGIIRAKWGLVPHFIQGIEKAKKSKIYTIDSKTILTDPRIRGSIRSRRCIVPVNYYEVNNYKIDVFYKHIFSLGAVYDTWEEKGKRYVGFALIITPSNETLKETDEFMPVYLKRHEEKVWLREHSLRIIKELTASYQNEMWISTRDNDSLIK